MVVQVGLAKSDEIIKGLDMHIIVGSTALRAFGLNRSEPKDVDTWYDTGDKPLGDSSQIPIEILMLVPTVLNHATPDAIYTIKCSHLAWDIKWDKTKADILWLEAHGCVIIPELYKALKAHWKVEHGNKDFLSLNKSKENFFEDNVTYLHEHDYLHELVAYPEKPMYTQCLKDGEDVMISEEKFNTMPHVDKVKMFTEEIVVIACERWLLNPFWDGKVSLEQAYKLSLKKTIVALTKNWANDFLIENLKDFIKTDVKSFKHIINTLGGNNMSKINIEVIRAAWAAYQEDGGGGYVSTLAEFVHALAEDEVTPTAEFEYKHLAQDGGGEGGSEYCYGVFQLKDVIYQAEWSYYSYHGDDIDYIVDSLRIVTPKEATVIQYV